VARAESRCKSHGLQSAEDLAQGTHQKWKVTVGEGDATPALVGDKLYVFSREQGNEVTRALNAADGKELWQDKYESLGATGPAQGHSGPRSSPAVADGKVVTLGVRGMISCLDAPAARNSGAKMNSRRGRISFRRVRP
jgi:outer membrane protein assembly factor BamB